MSVKMKILLRGPVLTRTGYGEHARFVLRSLRSKPDIFDIYIQPLAWGQTSWTAEMTEERTWIDQAIQKTLMYIQQGGSFDVSIQVTIPNEFEKIAPINIGVTAGIETNKVSGPWLQKANDMDRVIVVSEHSKAVFENTQYNATNTVTQEQLLYGLTTPIHSVGYPVKTFDSLAPLDLDLEPDFNFLAVAQVSPRKNIQNTIKWFFEEFKDDNVGLVLKGNMAKNCLMDRLQLMHNLKTTIPDIENTDYKCKFYLLHGDMTEAEIHSLYSHPKIKALVTFAHGEGFGLPVFEAAYMGLPIVAPGFSGYLDFLKGENGEFHFYDVGYDLNKVQQEAVWENIIVEDSMWAYAREQSAKEKMRECYQDVLNETGFAATASDYAKELSTRYHEEAQYKKFIEALDLETDADWLLQQSEIELL